MPSFQPRLMTLFGLLHISPAQSAATASKDECSCYHGFMPGIGFPGIGSLSCLSPFGACPQKCSDQYVQPCKFRALCTLSEGDGKHHCDCSMCTGITKDEEEYNAHCKPSTCPVNENCYYNGCMYNGSSQICRKGEGLECTCDFPRVLDDNNKCIDCPNGTEYDQKAQKFICKQVPALTV